MAKKLKLLVKWRNASVCTKHMIQLQNADIDVFMNRLLMKLNETRISEHTNLNRPKASVNRYIKRLAKPRN